MQYNRHRTSSASTYKHVILIPIIAGSLHAIQDNSQNILSQRRASWIECFERPYSVERYFVAVSSVEEMYSLLTYLLQALLRKGLTSLVFLPGKAEITWVMETLVSSGIENKCVVPFHADLDELQLETAKKVTPYAHTILSTSLAETSITLPDVDVVD